MGFLLDTCLLSEMTKPLPDAGVVRWLSERSTYELFVSVLTLGEIRHRVAKLPESKKKESLAAELERFELTYGGRLLDVNLPIARRWGEIRAAQEKAGSRLPVIDSLIAATALEKGLTVVTRNTSDFDRSGCEVLNIWANS